MSVEVVPGGVVYRSDDRHVCTPPRAAHYDPGDIFECGTCRVRHLLVDAQTYQGGPFWRALSEAGERQRPDR